MTPDAPSPEAERVTRLLKFVLDTGVAAPLRRAGFRRRRRLFHRARNGLFDVVAVVSPWYNRAERKEFDVFLCFSVPEHGNILGNLSGEKRIVAPTPFEALNPCLEDSLPKFNGASCLIDRATDEAAAEAMADRLSAGIEGEALPWFESVQSLADMASLCEIRPKSSLEWSVAYQREYADKLRSAAVLRYLDGDDAGCEADLARALAECPRSPGYDGLQSFAARLRAMMAARATGKMP